MIDEIKEVKPEEKKSEEQPRGPRGEIGQPTVALTIRQMYHASHFVRTDAGNKSNVHKQAWVKHPHAPSLKKFARQLIASGDQTARDWMDHKRGSLNAERSDANQSLQKLCASATKTAKKGKKQ